MSVAGKGLKRGSTLNLEHVDVFSSNRRGDREPEGRTSSYVKAVVGLASPRHLPIDLGCHMTTWGRPWTNGPEAWTCSTSVFRPSLPSRRKAYGSRRRVADSNPAIFVDPLSRCDVSKRGWQKPERMSYSGRLLNAESMSRGEIKRRSGMSGTPISTPVMNAIACTGSVDVGLMDQVTKSRASEIFTGDRHGYNPLWPPCKSP